MTEAFFICSNSLAAQEMIKEFSLDFESESTAAFLAKKEGCHFLSF